MEIHPAPAGLHAHPNPIPNPHHRKVELQSPLDLTYLRENVAAAAKQKLNLHFPPDATTRNKPGEQEGAEVVGNGAEEREDPMRARVATLVDDFLDRTYGFASHSISINGNDVPAPSSILSSKLPSTTANSTTSTNHPTTTTTSSTSASNAQPRPQNEIEREGIHFSYEAYDPRLATKVASLYAELERQTLAVSQLRRTAPSEGARAEGEALLRSIKADEEMDQGESFGDGKEDRGLKLEPLPDGWSEEVAEMYERCLEDLRRLGGGVGSTGAGDASWSGVQGGSLTETVGKVQRARDVAMEFE